MKYDFGGYATKNDIECSDGRIIRAHAFADQDGEQVPLVWQHGHDSVDNVLGHAVLLDTEDGVRCLCTFNDTKSGNVARELVKCGDIDSLSIHAGELIQHGKDVIKGLEVAIEFALQNRTAVMNIYKSVNRDIYEKYLWKIIDNVSGRYFDSVFKKGKYNRNDKGIKFTVN